MDLQKNQKGFIFSLDATLALLITLIALVGVAQIGASSTIYKQHGYIQLERYANDGLRILTLNGTMENSLQLLEEGSDEKAEQILRESLQSALPGEIQFRLSIKDQLTIYSSSYWEGKFKNINERAGSANVFPVSPWANFRVLAWLDNSYEENFMNQIKESNWTVHATEDLDNFRGEILKTTDDRGYYYDAVFVPDADVSFDSQTINNLETFSQEENRRFVVGGDTLGNNWSLGWLFDVNAISQELNDENYKTVLWNTDHYILRPYLRGHLVPYPADYFYYDYDPDSGLAYWGSSSEFETISWDLPAVIFENDISGTRVLFGMDFSKSTIVREMGTEEWKTLAKRAIYGRPFMILKQINLHVWRGGEVG